MRKRRNRGVDRLLKKRQELKNLAKELGIPLEQVFADAAMLKKKHEGGVAQRIERLATSSASGMSGQVAGPTPAPAAKWIDEGADAGPEFRYPENPERLPLRKISAGLEPAVAGAPPPASAAVAAPPQPGAPLNIFNEPMQKPAEQPREFGANGVRRAEPNPAIPEGTPYYIGRCVGCNEEMYTRDNKMEDVCETCAIMWRDDTAEGHQRMISQAAGQLVDPFKDGDF